MQASCETLEKWQGSATQPPQKEQYPIMWTASGSEALALALEFAATFSRAEARAAIVALMRAEIKADRQADRLLLARTVDSADHAKNVELTVQAAKLRRDAAEARTLRHRLVELHVELTAAE